MERTISVLIIIVLLVLLIVLALYFLTFGGSLSKVHGDWGDFGSIIGALGSLLFSAVNIGVWLYQSRLSIRAMNRQVILQEQLTLLTQLQSKLLPASKVHITYQEFDRIFWDSFTELRRWFDGIYEPIFKNDKLLLRKAMEAMLEIKAVWHKHNLSHDNKDEPLTPDLVDIMFDELEKHEQPLLDLVKYYRAQLDLPQSKSIWC